MRSLLLLLLSLALAPAAFAQYDVLLRGGRVLDGTGNPYFVADVALLGDRIAAVGDLSGATATRVIDAEGLYVAPGFVDVHSHAGPGLATPELSAGIPLLAQGVTTVFINPDGGGATDLPAQRAELEKDGLGVNVAQMVPHGSVRAAVLGMADRAPTPDEMEAMKALVRHGMEAGGFGLSSGLFYAPGSYASTAEVAALARETAPYGGVYSSHIRDESDYNVGVVAAVEEVIAIAREGGVPGVVTHMKALGPRLWGYAPALIRRIENARAEGIEVWADQYPYTASATGLGSALIPRWAQEGGHDAFLARLDGPDMRDQILDAMAENLDRRGGAERLQFRRHAADPSIEGRTLAAVAAERGMDPLVLALELEKAGGAGVVSFNMSDDDVEALMRRPWMMTSSDGGLVPMGEGVPHPRNYGAFARKLRHYVVERGVVGLPEAIRSMTHLPASVFRLAGRGSLREGNYADVVVFDLDAVADPATFTQPHQLSEGMVYVFVNGTAAVDGGRFTEEKAGRVLSRR